MSHSDQPADATAYRSSWRVAAAIFALSLLVFGAFAGSRLRQQSTDPHFVYLADSNLDWGQDLPALRAWVTRNNGRGLRLAYFGADTPWRHFTGKESVSTPPPWNDALAISATLLPGHFFKSQSPRPAPAAASTSTISEFRTVQQRWIPWVKQRPRRSPIV